jgi:hypothetical protein
VRNRILVTGGAGFISSNFVRHLLTATPHDVVSLDALTYAGNVDNLADVMGHERLSFVHGDIRDRGLVSEIVREVDVIVNAAAESHVEKSIVEGAREFVTTNVEGTQILLDAIRENPVDRFVLISSSEVYGTAEAEPMDEEHPLNPRSPYAATKAGADGAGRHRPADRARLLSLLQRRCGRRSGLRRGRRLLGLRAAVCTLDCAGRSGRRPHRARRAVLVPRLLRPLAGVPGDAVVGSRQRRQG